VLPVDGAAAVQVQVVVGDADASAGRAVQVYARGEQAAPGGSWTRHASGRLVPAGPPDPGLAGLLAVWPPAGAVPVETEGLYPGLAAAGYGYGPAFRGLRAAWRRAGEVFAEVALPQETAAGAGSFGVHPALLDAALHAAGLVGEAVGAGSAAGPGEILLPFAWTGVSVHAQGASMLRVRLARAADGSGALVVSADSLVSRPVPARQQAADRWSRCSPWSGTR
jgi:acyl transferase domain-containing protein